MKMEHCGRCGHTWGHHAGLSRCPKCGWNATQSHVRHPTVYPVNGTPVVHSKHGNFVFDSDGNGAGLGLRDGGNPRELDFG